MKKYRKINKLGQAACNCIKYDWTLKACFYYQENNQIIKNCPLMDGNICTDFVGKVVKQ